MSPPHELERQRTKAETITQESLDEAAALRLAAVMPSLEVLTAGPDSPYMAYVDGVDLEVRLTEVGRDLLKSAGSTAHEGSMHLELEWCGYSVPPIDETFVRDVRDFLAVVAASTDGLLTCGHAADYPWHVALGLHSTGDELMQRRGAGQPQAAPPATTSPEGPRRVLDPGTQTDAWGVLEERALTFLEHIAAVAAFEIGPYRGGLAPWGTGGGLPDDALAFLRVHGRVAADAFLDAANNADLVFPPEAPGWRHLESLAPMIWTTFEVLISASDSKGIKGPHFHAGLDDSRRYRCPPHETLIHMQDILTRAIDGLEWERETGDSTSAEEVAA